MKKMQVGVNKYRLRAWPSRAFQRKLELSSIKRRKSKWSLTLYNITLTCGFVYVSNDR